MSRTPEVAPATAGELRSHRIFRSSPCRSARNDVLASGSVLLAACESLALFCGRYRKNAAEKDATAAAMTTIANVHERVAVRLAEAGLPFAAAGGEPGPELDAGGPGAAATTASSPVLLLRCDSRAVN